MPRSQDPNTLSAQLTDAGYEKLFLYAGQEELHRLYNQFGAAAFDSLVGDASATSLSRLLAAESLYFLDKQPSLSPAEQIPFYVDVLNQQSIDIANPWGTPKQPEVLGKRLISFGKAALPSLMPLLDNTKVLNYAGSREATSGSIYKYRVKDLVASLICAIRGVAYEFQQEVAERDAWIAGNVVGEK